jgi:hypothetical protein
MDFFFVMTTRNQVWLQLRFNRLDFRLFEEGDRAAHHEPAGVVEIECWQASSLVHS